MNATQNAIWRVRWGDTVIKDCNDAQSAERLQERLRAVEQRLRGCEGHTAQSVKIEEEK